ncbi:putative family 31 glucosidase ORF2 [Diplodia seriata]|uniref:Putative family 31 glucosidase ORF2 n=1 Tax=Diplodia seriata TaxID=420778 RepID=A0A1S8BLU9_9PEZI|nr:putative family 31 glucosidase ORF2 [Diplodia seriata]
MFAQEGDKLIFNYDAEKLWIEPWGPNALRVRATKNHQMPTENWALDIPPPPLPARPTISIDKKTATGGGGGGGGATITNGKIQASLTPRGKLTVRNAHTGALLLEEYARNRADVTDPKCSALEIEAREFRPIPGSDAFRLAARFEPVDPRERIYGMGQYQQPCLDLKGADLELAQRNSQASVPFALSSVGYGLLWNNPAVGRAVFGKNVMSFEAAATKALDYWVVAGDEGPRELERAYAGVTGKVPMMPEFGLGFWQCKLRYQTQEELLEVAREYRRRELPIDLIVVDFFHWPKQGEWKFDPTYWPDPDAMIEELKELKIELMVSIWPTVDKLSENYEEMVERGYLIRTDRGVRTAMDFMGDTVHADFTNPDARQYVWEKVKKNYWDKGVRVFWIDEAEPEYTAYDFDNYRYHLGPNLQIGNLYPLHYARAFHDGQTAAGQANVVNLARCAWASSQRYGALVWSGDIASSWPVFRAQLAAGLNTGLAGIPWWTTDIGGFHGGDAADAGFRELFVRWFQWAAFCPVMRLHGDREPRQPQRGDSGGAACRSGAPNEVWSYGERVERICRRWMVVREGLRPYTRALMREAHETGDPVMRTCFYEFPDDKRAWEVEDQYLFGAKYLVAPVLYPGARTRQVYFPKGASWRAFEGEATFEGGTTAAVETPIESMPVFVRL